MAGGGCGTCQPGDNPTNCTIDTSLMRVREAARTMTGSWSQAIFPNVPCPSPQVITWQVKHPDVGSWVTLSTSTGAAHGAALTGGTGTQSAVAGVSYNRTVRFTNKAVGKTLAFRVTMACGSAFVSATRSVHVERPMHNVT